MSDLSKSNLTAIALSAEALHQTNHSYFIGGIGQQQDRQQDRLAQIALLSELGNMAKDGTLWYDYYQPSGDDSPQLKVLRIGLLRALTQGTDKYCMEAAVPILHSYPQMAPAQAHREMLRICNGAAEFSHIMLDLKYLPQFGIAKTTVQALMAFLGVLSADAKGSDKARIIILVAGLDSYWWAKHGASALDDVTPETCGQWDRLTKGYPKTAEFGKFHDDFYFSALSHYQGDYMNHQLTSAEAKSVWDQYMDILAQQEPASRGASISLSVMELALQIFFQATKKAVEIVPILRPNLPQYRKELARRCYRLAEHTVLEGYKDEEYLTQNSLASCMASLHDHAGLLALAANLSQDVGLEDNAFADHHSFFTHTVPLLWDKNVPASLSSWPLDAGQTDTYGVLLKLAGATLNAILLKVGAAGASPKAAAKGIGASNTRVIGLGRVLHQILMIWAILPNPIRKIAREWEWLRSCWFTAEDRGASSSGSPACASQSGGTVLVVHSPRKEAKAGQSPGPLLAGTSEGTGGADCGNTAKYPPHGEKQFRGRNSKHHKAVLKGFLV